MESLAILWEKDPVFAAVLEELIDYLASTYDDKYEDNHTLNYAREVYLRHPILGKGANIFTASKYIQRYATEGYPKSNNPQDLKKAIHFLLFELDRISDIDPAIFQYPVTPDEVEKPIFWKSDNIIKKYKIRFDRHHIHSGNFFLCHERNETPDKWEIGDSFYRKNDPKREDPIRILNISGKINFDPRYMNITKKDFDA